LTTHTILAGIVPVLAIITLTWALKGQFEKHKKIARWTFPIWVYVSVTGVVVYWMLFHLYTPIYQ
jgi:protein SCO1/2/putative membrane protein